MTAPASSKRLLGRGHPNSEAGRDCRDGLGGRHHREHLELHDIVPVTHPFVKQLAVVAFHDLVASSEVVRHPARHVLQAGRRHPPAITETAIDGHRIPTAKCSMTMKSIGTEMMGVEGGGVLRRGLTDRA